jgi:hypothetical protein
MMLFYIQERGHTYTLSTNLKNHIKEGRMKKWYFSKTVLVALVQFITGVVEAFFTEYPPEVGYALMAKSVIDFVLRKVTTEAIS